MIILNTHVIVIKNFNDEVHFFNTVKNGYISKSTYFEMMDVTRRQLSAHHQLHFFSH